eukprot:436766-Amphidinium_carterae.1
MKTSYQLRQASVGLDPPEGTRAALRTCWVFPLVIVSQQKAVILWTYFSEKCKAAASRCHDVAPPSFCMSVGATKAKRGNPC